MALGRTSIVLLAFAGACSTYAPHEADVDAGPDAGTADAAESDGGETDASDASDVSAQDDGDAGCPACPRYVFLASLPQLGNVGIAGGDAFCTARANVGVGPGAVLNGRTFVAWLSTPTSPVSARLTHGTGPYVRVDGMPVALDYAGLTSGALQNPIDLDETGSQPLSAMTYVWTGTAADGSAGNGVNCNGWTDPSGGALGAIGDAFATNASWTAKPVVQACNSGARLYCIEK